MIELAFHNSGTNKHRLYINPVDSFSHFKWRGEIVVIKYLDEVLAAKTSCGQFFYDETKNSIIPQKGFDLNSTEISDFIVNMKQASNNRSKGILCVLKKKSNFILLEVVGVNITSDSNRSYRMHKIYTSWK